MGTLDERQIGSYGHQEQDMHLFFADWGFDLVKVDACGVAEYGPDVDVVKDGTYAAFDSIIVSGSPGASRAGELAHLYEGIWQAAWTAKPGVQPIVSI